MLKPILLVEDHPKDLELTLYALEKHGVTNRVQIARDGRQALDYLLGRGDGQRELPAMARLDICLPKINGLEVLETIRSTPALRDLKVIMLTGSRSERDMVRSYVQGVSA